MAQPSRTIREVIDSAPYVEFKVDRGVSDYEDFLRIFDIEDYTMYSSEFDTDRFESRISHRYINKWICTDTIVGISVVYFDSEPVAIGFRPFRRSDCNYMFLSTEVAMQVRDFVHSCLTVEMSNIPVVDSMDTVINGSWFETGPKTYFTYELWSKSI